MPPQRPLPTLPLHSTFPAQLDVQHCSVPQTPSPICFRAAIQLSHQGPAQPFVNRGGGGVFNMERNGGGGLVIHIMNTNGVQHSYRFKCCFFLRLAMALQSLDACQDLIKLITAVSQCRGFSTPNPRRLPPPVNPSGKEG